MDAPLRKLTIVCPREVEAVLADALDAMEPSVPGYTLVEAHGRGAAMHSASAVEKVRGALRTAMFILILPRERVEDVTETVRGACPRPQISYWVEPVEDFGRLADA
ncbi:DUF3240 family protein [Hyphococcus luteus]|uniref:DUF3240 domain-containing protein n=1 Tax=Hyphococcus luteus TaxID=2058213 RepID=A0A2S7K1U0_9PROT|nr:DUF3240 family protein [Marinicaulis flavus]PQA86474.1 DUF3240 domain-containing protein [Marinicaulis flavus]